MKTEKISKLVLLICVVIAVVVVGAFFATLSNTNDEGEPILTEVIMWTMYLYVVVLAALTIGNLALAVTKFRDSGLIRVITYCGGSVALYFIFRVIWGGQEVPEGAEYTSTDMAVADAYIWTIGLLFVAAVAVTALCASGLMMKTATKK